MSPFAAHPHQPDSRYAMLRLFITLLIMTVGSSGMYVVSVVLPAVQADFGVARAEASLPYTLLMIGFGIGGVVMGKLADRYGVMWPLLLGAMCVGAGYVASSFAGSILAFSLVQALLIGVGSGAVFAPLVADTSLWFVKRRGMAVAVCASGNYLAGAVWPPIVQRFVEAAGWRATYVGLGVFCGLAMAGLALLMRPRPPALAVPSSPVSASGSPLVTTTMRPFGLSLGVAQGLLCVAGAACCVAMAMPQVHI
ncbi:MAG: MFS transporter, partial [Comamonadaceae bacterium]